MDETRTTPEKLVRNVMSPSPVTVGSDATVRDAARLLADGDVGALPCHERREAGRHRHRPRPRRPRARRRPRPDAPIGEIASADSAPCRPDASLDEAARLLGQAQVRRLPVVDARRLTWSGSSRRPTWRGTPAHELTGQAVAQISVPGAVGWTPSDQALAESQPASDPPSGPASVGGLRGG